MTSAVNQMGNFTQVGACPHCGAPLYSQSVWHGVIPPPVMYSCNCRGGNQVITTTNTSEAAQDKSKSLVSHRHTLEGEVDATTELVSGKSSGFIGGMRQEKPNGG